MITTTRKDDWLYETADSLDDILTFIESTRPNPAWKAPTSEKYWQPSDRRAIDRGTSTMGQALALARMGWPDGLRRMVRNLDAARMVQLGHYHKTESLDVAGAYPIVPLAVAGDPACMVTHGLDQSATKPIFRFVVNTSFVGDITGQTIENRGAAILAWADQLEAEGARVEILALRSTEGSGGNGGRYSVTVPVKRADEPLELDRAAFMLGNPAMLRRIFFAMAERHAITASWFDGHACRSSNYEPEDWKVPHSIYFNCLRDGDTENDLFKTPQIAARTIEAIIQSGLTQQQAQEMEAP